MEVAQASDCRCLDMRLQTRSLKPAPLITLRRDRYGFFR